MLSSATCISRRPHSVEHSHILAEATRPRFYCDAISRCRSTPTKYIILLAGIVFFLKLVGHHPDSSWIIEGRKLWRFKYAFDVCFSVFFIKRSFSSVRCFLYRILNHDVILIVYISGDFMNRFVAFAIFIFYCSFHYRFKIDFEDLNFPHYIRIHFSAQWQLHLATSHT